LLTPAFLFSFEYASPIPPLLPTPATIGIVREFYTRGFFSGVIQQASESDNFFANSWVWW
jgi:hypothetical protein